jgi:mono/diheme cytochrome c family protein
MQGLSRKPGGRSKGWRGALAALLGSASTLGASCTSPAPTPQEELIARGERLFFEETFAGNGRTCGTCHRAEDNFGLTPAFIATLPPEDPLFVAETVPALREGFESPVLMREFGLIRENQDGFDDLARDFNMRGVPHTLAMPTSIDSADGPRTGWSGDGAPGDGSLRAFATGAVIQHFPKTTDRVVGVDFRLPTDTELDALEAFQLSLGRRVDLELPLPLRGTVASRGQEIFLDNTLGKCNACHTNASANADPQIFGPGAGNKNFDTGVETLPDQPADLTDELVPPDDGFGVHGVPGPPSPPATGEFNTPPLVEAADTGPFFHNNSVETIEAAVAFYNGDAFTRSPAGELLIGATGSAINLDATQVAAVAAFLRVINALENIRASSELLERSRAPHTARARARELQRRASFEIDDAMQVLAGAGLHPDARSHLEFARDETIAARGSWFEPGRHVARARTALQAARNRLILPETASDTHRTAGNEGS